jgi:hypothetical protein
VKIKGLFLIVLISLVLAGCQDSGSDTGGGEETEDTVMVYSPVSGLPVPDPDAASDPVPAGTPGNLLVLEWAGYAGAVTYTFDDGQPSHIEHYEALNETGVRMTFFYSVNANPGHDTFWSGVVADGHEIGNHTVSHPHITEGGVISGAQWTPLATDADAEISGCSQYIIDHFGQAGVWTMASPFGDAGWDTQAVDHVLLNRKVGGGTIGADSSVTPHGVPSYMAAGGDTAQADFNPLMATAWSTGTWRIFCFHTIDPTSSSWYADVDIDELTGSLRYGKSLGDLWLDSFVNVGSYWIARKMFNGLTPATDGDDTVWTWTLPDHFPAGKYLRVTVDGGVLSQNGTDLVWDAHGYYEVALDEGELRLSPNP